MHMIKNIIQKFLNNWGYEIKKKDPVERRNGMEIYRYLKSDGSFDYDQYRQIQTAGNKRKINNVWVQEENVEFMANYIKSLIKEVNFGICHGTRNGKEQEWFKKYLGCPVIGTEISDNAEQYPDTIQWDFHEVKPEWHNAVDFIYSNALDHSYDPERCLNAWMSCIKLGGLCIIEHTSGHEKASELDPFGAIISEMPYLILEWGAGKFYVREIIEAPKKPEKLKINYIRYLVIQKIK